LWTDNPRALRKTQEATKDPRWQTHEAKLRLRLKLRFNNPHRSNNNLNRFNPNKLEEEPVAEEPEEADPVDQVDPEDQGDQHPNNHQHLKRHNQDQQGLH